VRRDRHIGAECQLHDAASLPDQRRAHGEGYRDPSRRVAALRHVKERRALTPKLASDEAPVMTWRPGPRKLSQGERS